MHPTEEEIRQAAGVPSVTSRKTRKHEGPKKSKDEPLTVPKSTALHLEAAVIDSVDILPLHFYLEYQWLVDFSFCGLIVYATTDVYYTLFGPANEFNLSMMWCLLMVGFSIKVLYSLTAIYFRTEEAGERILCVVFAFFFLVLAMGVLIIDEDTLEFNLISGYRSFSSEANTFLKKQGMESAGPATLTSFRIVLAFVSCFLGAFLTFPGLRLAKMHSDAIKYAAGNPFKQLALYFNMIFPLIITLMWVKPVSRQYLVERTYSGRNLITNEQFDAVRIIVLFAFCLVRFLLCWSHLQAHLNLAYEKALEIRKEAGRISVVELQRVVARVFFYLCVVALQYLAPLILLLSCVFMLKTLGEYSFEESFDIQLPTLARNRSAINQSSADPSNFISSTSEEFSLALASLKQIFTPLYFRGLFSFLCWCICTCWFTTSAFGLVYYSYFTKV